MVQRTRRRRRATFAVAESGLEHALADLAADPRFERLRLGPDGRRRRRRRRRVSVCHAAAGVPFRRAPFRYEVASWPRSADRVEHRRARLRCRSGACARGGRGRAARRRCRSFAGALGTDAAAARALELGDDWRIDGAGRRSGRPDARGAGAARRRRAAIAAQPTRRARLRGPGGAPSLRRARRCRRRRAARRRAPARRRRGCSARVSGASATGLLSATARCG